STAKESIGNAARTASARLTGQTGHIREAAKGRVGQLTTKKPDPYEVAVAEYNSSFTAMADRGLSLLRQRERSTDLVELIEQLVNSIANTPKSFATDFDEIQTQLKQFLHAEEF